jgi:hypothetical protein
VYVSLQQEEMEVLAPPILFTARDDAAEVLP